MSQQEDKKPKQAKTETGTAAEREQNHPGQPDHRKDPDEYDPVGMAGKKAGILLEPGEEASEAAKEESIGGGLKEDRRKKP